jgi:hypothetical protein
VTDKDATAERVGHNNAVFRNANERIQGAAAAYAVDGLVPFLCECPDPTCTKLVRMPLDDYEAVRSTPTRFINALGHADSPDEWSTVVARRDSYEIVEKTGVAARVAEALDPRSG